MSQKKILTYALIGTVLLFIVYNLPARSKTDEKKIEENLVFESAAPPIELVEVIEEAPSQAQVSVEDSALLKPISNDDVLPAEVDRMAQLFQPYPPTLPFIETISYSGRVDWLTGRPAYLGDYASYYQTSKHFISRSLHGMGNYLSDTVSKGDRFNVFKKDKEIDFHLVLDLSRLKIWLYIYDKEEDSRILLKTYPVCAGRLEPQRVSGSLTPLGTFTIANEISVNEPGMIGNFKNEMKELITIFGVRWIPIGREISDCTGSSKGLGLHGVPWRRDPHTQELREYRECIGKYESGGCIRLLTEDIEELYAVIVSKPAYIHIVKDFIEARLPGTEEKSQLVFK